MHFLKDRLIEPEILDDLPLEAAAASLKDLVRINRYLGGHELLRRSLASLVGENESFTFLDVGAASGDMGKVVSAAYNKARVFSLDYKAEHLHAASNPKLVGDAFRLPFRAGSFDFVHCSLFLHHFSNNQVVELLRSFGQVASRNVVLSDLERHVLAHRFLPLTRWLFRWDPVTLHDGPISVAAGFKRHELSSLAEEAGLQAVQVQVHRPCFRLSLVAKPTS
jgi:2-polyprenyl-3-methyl-5-hydroxy-6-metoxy-1,4-benzoquinol methylase